MSQDISANNRRIAKNTILLYIRMGIMTLVGLYTSRVVLHTLGVEDYGIYGVVGSIVAFMGFLNASMSGATSRFLTFELGCNNQQRLNTTFISSFWVHLIIAAIVLLLAETMGLWFLYNKLVIPESRFEAALWVYQFSIISAVVGITQVPYNASVISHEDMSVYAYVEIVSTVLKLLIVFLLQIISYDKLILYAVLYLIVTIGVAMYYRWYCIKHYPESRLLLLWDKPIASKILKYSVFDLYGNFSVTAKNQGRVFLINMFFGVAINAASSIANVVTGTIWGFTGAIQQAFRPQIIKCYAAGDINQMQQVSVNSIKYAFLLMSIMAVPVIYEANYVFTLWLGIVPNYTVIFCRLIILGNFVGICAGVVVTIIHATGNIKRLSFISGTVHLLTVPITYFMYLAEFPVESAFILEVISLVTIFVINLFIVKYNIREIAVSRFCYAVIIAIAAIIPGVLLSYFCHITLSEGFLRLVSVTMIYFISTASITYYFVIDKETRYKLQSYITQKTQRYTHK